MPLPKNHTYSTKTCNSITLCILETTPDNIQIVNFMRKTGTPQKIRDTSYYGINGGWFNPGGRYGIDNIAYQDGQAQGSYDGNGEQNEVGTGLIYWNGTTLGYSRNVSDSSAAVVPKKNGWAQGGIALYLGDPDWKEKVRSQPGASQYLDTILAYPRTGMVINSNLKKVYLIVATNLVYFSAFRDALRDFCYLDDTGVNNGWNAIMLDGGGSTQLKAKTSSGTDVSVNGAKCNPVPQIIALKDPS